MAKRRSEDCLRYESPSKRCCAPRSLVDKPPDSMALTSGGGSPPALLALLGSRCRKRPHYFEDQESQVETEEAVLHGKATHCDAREDINAAAVQCSGSFQEPRMSSGLDKHPSKRARTDSKSSEVGLHGNAAEDSKEKNTEEDSTYNSFQYWRVPLPKLDLSLLEDAPQTKEKYKLKDCPADAMET